MNEQNPFLFPVSLSLILKFEFYFQESDLCMEIEEKRTLWIQFDIQKTLNGIPIKLNRDG